MNPIFIEKVLSLKEDILKVCGFCCPWELPVSRCLTTPLVYKDKYRDLFGKIFTAHQSILECENDAYCIHAIRIISWYLRGTLIPYKLKPTTYFELPVTFLWLSCESMNEEGILSPELKKMGEHLTNTIANSCCDNMKKKNEGDNIKFYQFRQLNNVNIFRFSSLHNVYTSLKKTIKMATSNIVTLRHARAVEDLQKVVEPDSNYARALAVLECCSYQLTFLKPGQVYTITEILKEYYETHADFLVNADFLQLMDLVQNLGWAHLTSKLIQVNPDNCSCMTKCIGPLGDYHGFAANFAWDAMKDHCSEYMCGLCRMFPSVEMPSSSKSRMTYCSLNPKQLTCSKDSCSRFVRVQLVYFDIKKKHTSNASYFKYAHRFYTTSSIPITNELSGTDPKRPPANIYGICFGKRTCKKRITTTYRNKTSGSFFDLKSWFLCDNCQAYNFAQLGAVSSLGFSTADDLTCLHKYFQGKLYLKDVCRGCKIAASCTHLDEILVYSLKRSNIFPKSILTKIKLLSQLRKSL